MTETLIRNAVIYDGTGTAPFRSSVLIQNGRIVKIGNLGQCNCSTVIDAAGLSLSPGFINTHSHMDLEMFRNTSISASIRQGVTTECLGQDGSSVTPVKNALLKELADNMAPLAGTIKRPYFWNSFAEYMAQVEKAKPDVRFVSLVGHGTIRMNVMGSDIRESSAAELKAMGDLLDTCLKEGAKGLSFGLEYPPGSYALTNELVELSKVVARHDGIVMIHMRNEDRQLLESIREVEKIVLGSGVRLQISHFKVGGASNRGQLRQGLKIIEALHEKGFDISFDQYPYTAGCTGLKLLVPQWAFEGGEQGFQERLNNVSEYTKVLKGTEELIAARDGGGSAIMIASVVTDEYAWMSGKKMDEIAEKLGMKVSEAVLQILRHEGPAVVAIYFTQNEDDVTFLMQNDLHCVCTDGIAGAHPHPRMFSSFPRFLGRYVRDKKLMPLETAIRKITLEPARRLRLWDRGIIREGMSGDLVLFNPETIMDTNSYSEPSIYPAGIEKVWVEGDLKFSSILTSCAPGEKI